MANDFDALAMQGEDTGVADPERHQITVLDNTSNKPASEDIEYTMDCSCGWRSAPCKSIYAAWAFVHAHLGIS